jgi:hypothetical protein
MVSTGANGDNGEPLDNGVPYRQTTAEDRQVIFFTCRSTMVNGRPKEGIFQELANQLRFKPRLLLNTGR